MSWALVEVVAQRERYWTPYHFIFYIWSPHFMIYIVRTIQFFFYSIPPSSSQQIFVLQLQCFVGGGKRAAGVCVGAVPSSIQGASVIPSKSPYEHYHAALDQMSKPHSKDISREGPSAGADSHMRWVQMSFLFGNFLLIEIIVLMAFPLCEKCTSCCWPNTAQRPFPAPKLWCNQKGITEAAARFQTSPHQQVSLTASL